MEVRVGGSGRSRSACCSASVSGRSGVLWPGQHRPASEPQPRRGQGPGVQFPGQPGLADPRLARQAHQLARAVQDLCQCRAQHGKLILPPDHDRAGAIPHHSILPPPPAKIAP